MSVPSSRPLPVPFVVQTSNSALTVFGAGTVPSGTEKDARPLGGGGPGGLLSGNSGTPAPVRPHAKAQRTSIGPSEP